MKFHLVDRIEQLEPGQRIVAVKALSLAEEYLADHFPAFPVLPGVMMLEAMVQSAAWLTRIEQDFAKSVVVLARARNVRYASFVHPGDLLRCDVQAREITDTGGTFNAAASVEDQQVVSARLELGALNLADRGEHLAQADQQIIDELRKRWALIGGEKFARAGAN